MHTPRNPQNPAGVNGFYHKPEHYCTIPSRFNILNNNASSPATGNPGVNVSFEPKKEEFYTLESSTPSPGVVVYNSPSDNTNISSQTSRSRSSSSDPARSYGSSPVSGTSGTTADGWKHKLRDLEVALLGSDSKICIEGECLFQSRPGQSQSNGTPTRWNWNHIMTILPELDVKQILIACAEAIHDNDGSLAADYMKMLEQIVSVSGNPIQRLGAYMLEGLRARLELSGSNIYKTLNCEQPTSSELMTYMHVLYNICPYWKFAYTSANAVICEAMENEPRIHIIDFQIAQGTQWALFMQAVANRQGGPPHIRLTGVDDSNSFHARGGGLQIVGERLKQVAEKYNVPFEFHDTTMTTGCDVELSSLGIQPGEAIAVNFPYILHHMPDESVSTWNHRDRLLRLVKSLSPKVVTLIEQESNTNTSPFYHRFLETMEYYTAMFESIDVVLPRDDVKRINAEQHCVARDIVNMLACEGAERVERHELFGKWKARMKMDGFFPYPLSAGVKNAVREMLLKEYHMNYRIEDRQDGALYLYWLNRAMATTSAWR